MQIEINQLERRYAGLRIVDLARQGRLTASLLQNGQHAPVVVVPSASDRFVLIDGYARVAALESLGRDLVEAVILQLEEREALVLGFRQETTRRRSALEEGWLIQTLVEDHDMSQRELSIQLGRSKSWVSRRLSLVQVLPIRVQDAIKRGVVSAHAAEKYLVPLARANPAHCEDLVTNLEGERLSVRQMERLYVMWRVGDEEQKQRIIGKPLLFLRVDEEEVRLERMPRKLGKPLLLVDLEAVVRDCRRVRRRLRQGEWERVTGVWLERLETTWQEAHLVFSTLEVPMEEEPHVGPGHPHSDLETSRAETRDTHDRQSIGCVTQCGQTHLEGWKGRGSQDQTRREASAAPGQNP